MDDKKLDWIIEELQRFNDEADNHFNRMENMLNTLLVMVGSTNEILDKMSANLKNFDNNLDSFRSETKDNFNRLL